jgi:hypothetical protein
MINLEVEDLEKRDKEDSGSQPSAYNRDPASNT